MNTGTNPVTGTYDLTFSLYNAGTGGSQTGSLLTNSAVGVTNGLFTVSVDFGAVFTGTPYWLQIGVRTNATGTFTPLTPRQQLTPAPYAIFADTANNLNNGLTIQQNSDGAPNVIGGSPVNFVSSGVVGATVAGGGATNASGVAYTNSVTASFGTVSGGANNTASGGSAMVGGGNYNTASGPAAFVGGGGYDGNVSGNTASGAASVVAGGFGNQATNTYATVPGGAHNTAGGNYATVGGGNGNTATGGSATVSGGSFNVVSGPNATVGGGAFNMASGADSFAAGQQAQALNQGAFVWADSQNAVFASTANDQFLIRARGGVGIGTASPEQGLSVYSGIDLDQAQLNAGFLNNGNTNGYGLSFGIHSGEGIASQRTGGSTASGQDGLEFYTDFVNRMTILQNGNVGIGTTNPIVMLEVNGNVKLDGNQLLLEPGTGGSFDNDGLVFGDGGLPGINSGYGPWLAGYVGGALGALDPNVVALSWDASGDVAVNRNQIVGGSLSVGTNGSVAALEIASSGSLGSPQLQLDQQANDYARLRFAPSSYSPWDIAVKTVMNFYVNGRNVMTLATNGDLTVGSLTITGGSDLAEPFSFSAADQEISQGSVVIIDEANPGQLKLTNQPYDTHVAGIVSGANGIHPGIQMHQEGVLEGGKNVALSGRVYVQADTSNGAIKPGDLLTTSSTPGRAMKVSDHARAAGAILGKAMSSLSDGQGMVLVLVTLQ